ncbi:DUF883 family protein [Mesorhizobium retamae]|uniref:DUF883 domain-containing protein n=1 Tax=Mesorhizobium retamae TaxID=2912854 RepID=A0ABS9QAZ5_9HYPH|nr:hypothetical protein [Mesorhizobium sp. IRAMC:0171]MCG7504573.1 hypothetical protein [Mesorhizobium sp. IRAMC:0171]
MARTTEKISETTKSTADLEADIRQLQADIEKLTRQLAETGEHGFTAARRVAAQGAEHLRQQGEAAMEKLRGNAHDIEDQLAATVREKPITALAMAAGAGFLFALLSRR